ncbi:hypothetical protein EVAR_42839_1 [Eumeta japonica]|uniref:Uncharacterized protein n=1 Tax=Eumeta variegata TaxID=151549 RepID=A0A4C1WFM1_EUMVA|nr:hypothetical protein EVAR_42839_1 [Eumeta japonica]
MKGRVGAGQCFRRSKATRACEPPRTAARIHCGGTNRHLRFERGARARVASRDSNLRNSKQTLTNRINAHQVRVRRRFSAEVRAGK